MNNSTRYRVADLVIDLGQGRVHRGDEEIPLPKLSFDLLITLIRAAPNLVSMDEAMEKVWPGLVVSPETASQRVKLLRDALGDDPKAPRYIAGLRGRGYQLIAPVELVAAEPVPLRSSSEVGVAPVHAAPLSAGSASAARTPLLSIGWLTILALVLIAALCVTFVIGVASRTRVPPQSAVPPASVSVTFSPPPHSVAVLAFTNMSGDPKDEYFSDGLAEELLDSLARIPELDVAARTSAFSFKGTSVDVPTIGRRLNVRAVLEGSVRKSGNKVRITAQLNNTSNGYHLWSQTYDRELKDIFAVQTEIATAVAGALKVTLLANEGRKLHPGGTLNPQAFDAFLRGRMGERSQDEPGLRRAIAAFDEAIAHDPTYADAHAWRGDVLDQYAGLWERDPSQRSWLEAEARRATMKAVAIAPNSGLAYQKLAGVLTYTTSDYAAMDAAYRRSVELAPGDSAVLMRYAGFAAMLGREDALSFAERSAKLDPLSMGTHGNMGMVYFYLHRHEDARAAYRAALSAGANRLNLNWAGMNELAAGAARAAVRYCRDPAWLYDQICLAIAYYKLGDRRQSEAMLQQVLADGERSSYEISQIYAQRGELDKALQWLEKAREVKSPGLVAIRADPLMSPLRGRPQFKALVVQLHLPT